MNKKRIGASVLLSVGIVVAGVMLMTLVGTLRASGSMEDVPVDKPIPKVVVQVLKAQTVQDTRILTGRIAEWEAATLSAEREGRIEAQRVEEGDRVSAGDELVRIDATKAVAHRDQALAESKLAEQELSRIQGLRDQSIASPRELDQAVARRQAAQAALRVAELELSESVVISPLDGIVDYLFQEKGEYTRAGSPLVRIVQVDRIKFVLGIPERDLPYFSEGDPVLAFVDAYPERTFVGMIHRIATSADPSTLTFITEVEIDNADGALRPGMMAKAVLIRADYPNAIAIPLFALLKEGERHYAFIEENGVAVRREVVVGFFEGEHILVREGLEAGERLVVVGQRQLEDGQPVQVREVVEQETVRPFNPFSAP